MSLELPTPLSNRPTDSLCSMGRGTRPGNFSPGTPRCSGSRRPLCRPLGLALGTWCARSRPTPASRPSSPWPRPWPPSRRAGRANRSTRCAPRSTPCATYREGINGWDGFGYCKLITTNSNCHIESSSGLTIIFPTQIRHGAVGHDSKEFKEQNSTFLKKNNFKRKKTQQAASE